MTLIVIRETVPEKLEQRHSLAVISRIDCPKPALFRRGRQYSAF